MPLALHCGHKSEMSSVALHCGHKSEMSSESHTQDALPKGKQCQYPFNREQDGPFRKLKISCPCCELNHNFLVGFSRVSITKMQPKILSIYPHTAIYFTGIYHPQSNSLKKALQTPLLSQSNGSS